MTSTVAEVVGQQNHQPSHPLVHQVGEGDEESGHTVMQDILVVLILWLDEGVGNEVVEMLAEGSDIENFHG